MIHQGAGTEQPNKVLKMSWSNTKAEDVGRISREEAENGTNKQNCLHQLGYLQSHAGVLGYQMDEEREDWLKTERWEEKQL